MSEFHVQVVEIGKVDKHPNADTLSITTVHGGYPVIIRTGEFQQGDRAVYVPVDAMVPLKDERWAFLKKDANDPREYQHIKAKKLRGIFSMGILTKADPNWELGQNVQEALGIIKWEPEVEKLSTGGECEKDPGFMPCYTDLEGLRKYRSLLKEGETVMIAEKIHGANGRWVFHEGRLWVGSRTQIKREMEGNLWWRAAKLYNLEEKLSKIPGIVCYGEVFGQVQDLRYDAKPGEIFVRFFDAYDISKGKYLNYPEFHQLMDELDLDVAPPIYFGPWNEDLMSLANGKSKLANHIREGFVVRPFEERWDPKVGRVIFKMVGEDYLLRK